jgi:superfamily I DNA/RNA helicase
LHDLTVDDLDGGKDDNGKYKSLVHGAAPSVKLCPNFKAEVKAIAEFVKAVDDPKSTCLVTRTQKERDLYNSALGEHGISTYRIQRTQAENRAEPGLRLATMHRVKGLEFDRVIVAGLNEGAAHLHSGDAVSEDRGVREEADLRERSLFYVASTRARKELLVTCGGKPSKLLKNVKDL